MSTVSGSWRDFLETIEVDDATALAGDLFRRRFGHPIPDYPRHFVLRCLDGGAAPRVVAYVHQLALNEVYLCGGMCVDEGAYRLLPKPLFAAVKSEGGLATIVTRDSIAMLGDAPAVFGHVGEPRARQADLRTGFVDTDRPPLMVVWRAHLPAHEQRRLIDMVAAFGPF